MRPEKSPDSFGSKNKPVRDRNARLLRVIRNWFHGEVLEEARRASGAPKNWGVHDWIRKELGLSAVRAMKGHHGIIDECVRAAIKDEIARIRMGGWEPYLRRIIEEEVRKAVMQSITFEATITGHAHTPAAGERALSLASKEEADA